MLRFLKSKSDQISGFKSSNDADEEDEGGAEGAAIYEEFCAKLREFDASLLESAMHTSAEVRHDGNQPNGDVGKATVRKPKDSLHTNGHALPTSFELDLDAEELADVPW